MLTCSLSPLVLTPFHLNGMMERNTTWEPTPQSSLVKTNTLQVVPESIAGAHMEEYQGVIVRGLAKLWQLQQPGPEPLRSSKLLSRTGYVRCLYSLQQGITDCYLLPLPPDASLWLRISWPYALLESTPSSSALMAVNLLSSCKCSGVA